MVALACQPAGAPPRGPANPTEPSPQKAFNEPKVQQPVDPLKTDRPVTEPEPQRSAMETPTPQAPLTNPEPQKPFYGPGTKAPENRVLAKTEKRLSDAEVLGVATAANAGEVRMAEVGLKHATAQDVKDFAMLMKKSHQAALHEGKALEEKTKLRSAESEVGAYLKSNVEQVLKDLEGKTGKDFDRTFIDAQVKVHRDTLTAIDNRLIPSATDPKVKSLVTSIRHTVSDHLSKAEAIQKKLGPEA
jgi:putative membrane protein